MVNSCKEVHAVKSVIVTNQNKLATMFIIQFANDAHITLEISKDGKVFGLEWSGGVVYSIYSGRDRRLILKNQGGNKFVLIDGGDRQSIYKKYGDNIK